MTTFNGQSTKSTRCSACCTCTLQKPSKGLPVSCVSSPESWDRGGFADQLGPDPMPVGRTKFLAGDKAVGGPFNGYAPWNRHRTNAARPLPDQLGANAQSNRNFCLAATPLIDVFSEVHAPDIKRAALELQARRFFGKLSATRTVQPMNTVGEARRENLETLIDRAGTLDAVALAAESSSVYLSQIRNRAPDAKTGRPREMGSGMARRLEKAYSLTPGWMDQKHASRVKFSLAEDEARELGLPVVATPIRESTLGQLAKSIAGSVVGLPAGTRRLISQTVAELVMSGPNEQLASAIDVMAPDIVTYDGRGNVSAMIWAKVARDTAMKHQDPEVRELLLDFLTVVQDQIAQAAPAAVAKDTGETAPP